MISIIADAFEMPDTSPTKGCLTGVLSNPDVLGTTQNSVTRDPSSCVTLKSCGRSHSKEEVTGLAFGERGLIGVPSVFDGDGVAWKLEVGDMDPFEGDMISVFRMDLRGVTGGIVGTSHGGGDVSILCKFRSSSSILTSRTEPIPSGSLNPTPSPFLRTARFTTISN